MLHCANLIQSEATVFIKILNKNNGYDVKHTILNCIAFRHFSTLLQKIDDIFSMPSLCIDCEKDAYRNCSTPRLNRYARYFFLPEEVLGNL